MKKKIIALLIAAVLLLGLCACGGESPKKEITVNLSEYAVVANRDSKYARAAADALTQKLTEVGLTLPDKSASEKRIVIGDDGSQEYRAAYEKVKGNEADYIVSFQGNTILFAAKTDLILEEACNAFFLNYVKNAKEGTFKVTEGKQDLATAKEATMLVANGKALYEIVVASETEEITKQATKLADLLKSCGADKVTLNATYDAAKKQILIGKADFAETERALEKINENDYIVTADGNKIVLVGGSDASTAVAVEAFCDQILFARSSAKDGAFAVLLSEPIVEQYCAPLKSIPAFPDTKRPDLFPTGNGSNQYHYSDADPNNIDEYLVTLAGLGYTKTEDNTVAGNRFVTCKGKNGLVHVSYLKDRDGLTVITDPLTSATYKTEEADYTKVTETTLAVMSLDYSHRDKTDGNGMSYVITLEDGRYIIFDGGYMNSSENKGADHHILYNYLKDNNKRPDGRIVIAAWIFTHCHSDHIGAFRSFVATYASKVDVQYYVYNAGDASMYDQKPNTALDSIIHTLMRSFFPKSERIIPHTGQTLKFCNVTFEVLFTQESHAPEKMEWVNDSSLILRMTANGVSTLFLADSEEQTSNRLLAAYGNALKSDIMQVPHHAYSGGTIGLYEAIRPDLSLWPTSKEAFEQRILGGGNASSGGKKSNKWLGENCPKHFVADGEIEVITFVGGSDKISVDTYEPVFTQTNGAE